MSDRSNMVTFVVVPAEIYQSPEQALEVEMQKLLREGWSLVTIYPSVRTAGPVLVAWLQREYQPPVNAFEYDADGW